MFFIKYLLEVEEVKMLVELKIRDTHRDTIKEMKQLIEALTAKEQTAFITSNTDYTEYEKFLNQIKEINAVFKSTRKSE
jgi:hypothetical protein